MFLFTLLLFGHLIEKACLMQMASDSPGLYCSFSLSRKTLRLSNGVSFSGTGALESKPNLYVD